MVLAGNMFCFVLCVVENFFYNGLWYSWGQLTTIFKSEGLYSSFCRNETVGQEINCEKRDILFNNVFTVASIAYAVSSFGMGILMDKYGVLMLRSFTFTSMTIGLTLMTFIEDEELLIWGAWPLIATGGVCNQMANMKMTLVTPSIKSTLMATLSGSLVAAGSSGLIMEKLVENYDFGLKEVFLCWLVPYIFLAMIKIIFWSPHFIPVILTDNEYSIFENSAILSYWKNRKNVKNRRLSNSYTTSNGSPIKEDTEIPLNKYVDDSLKPTWKILLNDISFWLVCVGTTGYMMQANTYQSWLGSGWPEWVAADGDPEQFNKDINRLQSIATFTLIFFTIIPGLWTDFCRRRHGVNKGTMIGLCSCFFVAAVCFTTSSLLRTQQNENMAFSSIIIYNTGRFMSNVWNPMYFHVFPQELYGLVYGGTTIIAQPFTLLNIPMLAYNTANKDYSVMNYVIAACAACMFSIVIACYLRYKQLKPKKLTKISEL